MFGSIILVLWKLLALSSLKPDLFIIDYFAVSWYNISKGKIVRIISKHCFVGCFAPNNIVKGCVSVVVNSI